MAFAPCPGADGAAARFDADARRVFLDHLALTSNVKASARAAGIAAQIAYTTRRRDADFAARWQTALAEGFARLEGELLAEALRAVTGEMSDATLKARAQKHRLALALLSQHRASVRGVKAGSLSAIGSSAADKVKAKLLDMYDRVYPARADG